MLLTEVGHMFNYCETFPPPTSYKQNCKLDGLR